MQKKPSLTRTMLACSSLLGAMLACSLGSARPSQAGNITVITRETPLDTLSDSQHILTLVDYFSESEGMYWLDLDTHTLYLAKLPEAEGASSPGTYTWLPESGMSVWNGNELVYGSRLHGFFALSPDGTSRPLTGQGYVGRLAHNGEQILRFRQCGDNNEGRIYAITSLDQLVPSSAPCFFPGYFRLEGEAWKYVEPIWNPYLPQVDFIVSERLGRGEQMRVISNALVRLGEDDQFLEVLDLGTDFDISTNTVLPRPDGRAFYVRSTTATRIVDVSGNQVVDLKDRTARFSDKKLNGRFAWSPNSQQAVFLLEDCVAGESCTQTVLLLHGDLQQIQEITALPAGVQFDEILWSPDSRHIALVRKTHDGPGQPPRVYTIDLVDKSVNDYVFPTQSILENLQWVR